MSKKKPRLFISLSPEALEVLRELAQKRETTKSVVIENYLLRAKRRLGENTNTKYARDSTPAN